MLTLMLNKKQKNEFLLFYFLKKFKKIEKFKNRKIKKVLKNKEKTQK